MTKRRVMGDRYTVFISYSSIDLRTARFISGQIEAVGADYFLDDAHLRAGDRFREVICHTIPKCQELLLLLSATSLASYWLPYELGAAEQSGLHIAPLLLGITANDVAKHPGWLGLVSDRTMLSIDRLGSYLQQLRERALLHHDSAVIRSGATAIAPGLASPSLSELQREIELALNRLGRGPIP